MTAKVQGVVATAKGAPVELTTVLVPTRGPARRWSGSRRAVSAIPTCTIARAASARTFPTCSGTRPRAWWKPWAMT